MPPSKKFQVKFVIPVSQETMDVFREEAVRRGITMTNLGRICLDHEARLLKAAQNQSQVLPVAQS